MVRQIIKIYAERCTGCGLCAEACHEKAIGMANGKAVLLRDDLCDGMGLCLPACPAGALSFEEREAAPFDEAAVRVSKAVSPGAVPAGEARPLPEPDAGVPWPIQLRLVPVNAPQLDDAELLVAADCSAFVYPDFYRSFVKGRVALIGCPKLDDTNYTEKLAEVFRTRSIRSVLLIRMEVPCCAGLEKAVRGAARASGKDIPLVVRIMGRNGAIKNTQEGRFEAAEKSH